MADQPTNEYDFRPLADEYKDYRRIGWEFTFSNVVLKNDWTDPAPTEEQFNQFLAEIENGKRCDVCGKDELCDCAVDYD